MSSAIRKLGKHTSIYMLGTIAGKFASFLLLPVYTRFLTPANYGVLEMLSVTTELTGIIVALGLSSSMLRYWSKYEDEAQKRKVISTTLGSTLLFAALGIGLALLFNPLLAKAALGKEAAPYAFALLLSFVATFFEVSLVPPLDALRMQQLSGWFVGLSLARSIANMALTAYLVAIQKMGIYGSVWANVAIGGLSALLLLWYTAKKAGGIKISWPLLREMLGYGLPFVPTALAMYALFAASRFFLRKYQGLEAVGLFALGYKISSLLQVMVTAPFNRVWSWQMFEVEKEPHPEITVGRVMTYYVAGGAGCALLLAALSPDLLRVMASNHRYWSAYQVVPLLTLGAIFYGAAWISGTGFYLKNKTLQRTYVVFITAGLNIILNILLVPRYGAQGAAGAGALAFLALLIGSGWMTNKIFPVHWEWRRLLQAFGLAALLTLLALGSYRHWPALIPGAGIRLLLTLAFPVGLWATGFFTEEELTIVRRRLRRRKGEQE
jgi:O-antigen/teichoic acid export membrane protein